MEKQVDEMLYLSGGYMEFKKSQLTKFAKDCSYGLSRMIDAICMAEEIIHSDIGMSFKNGIEEELLIEISKRFAKYTNDTMQFDADTGDVQDFQTIICKIIDCCEENNWFDNQ